MCERLRDLIPQSEFYCEEEDTKSLDGKYVWVIDPIDGTSNFIYEYRPSVVSVGLLKDGKPYMNAYINARDVDLCGAPQKEN